MAAERARQEQRGFLTRLRRDTAGNTMAMMAAALIPLCAFAGSAMDMARLYVVKVRLQQACDAGALAGRKFLPNGEAANGAGAPPNIVNNSVASTDTTADINGRTLAADGAQAVNYFNSNIESSWVNAGWFSAGTDKFSAYTVADAQNNTQVQGTATAQVPMTLMQMFGVAAQTLSVTCQATFSTPDTDVMFVLDTTGSMGCAVTRPESVNSTPAASSAAASCSDPGGYAATHQASTTVNGVTAYYIQEEMSGSTNISRIDALRQAVNGFYDTVSKKKDPLTRVRYGFVPYTSTVNVGNLLYSLSSNNLVSKWSYQSRIATDDYQKTQVSSQTVNAASATACAAYASRTPAATPPYRNAAGDVNPFYPNNGTATRVYPTWTAANGNNPATCTVATWQVTPYWTYQGGVQYDLTNYLKGNSMVDPSRVDGSKTIWNGCIEERDTTAGATSFSQTSLPPDLDPDLAPTSDSTRWRPLWPDVEYARQIYGYTGAPGPVAYQGDLYTYNNPYLAQAGAMSCPAQAQPLFYPNDQASGATTVGNYVAGLRALGGTYLDVGMIWGARLLSPNGIWKSNNTWPAGRAAPQRMVIFVTDGNMSPGSSVYGAYGVEMTDRRVTGTTFASTDDPASNANIAQYVNFHNQRLLAECAKVKTSQANGGLGADVWVVEVAQASTASSATQLAQCASRTSQVLVGATTAQLNAAFQQIAAQVAMLRVTQ